jgi:hypothetical protein
MSHRYFTLIRREADGKWAIEFGDYSRRTVQDELEDTVGGWEGIRRKDLRIIQTSDDQASINAAVTALNA